LKSLRIVFILAILVALVASFGAAEERVKLQFAGRFNEAGNLAPPYHLFLQFIEEYQALNPHVEIEYIGETSGSTWVDLLLVRAAAFGMPDIVLLHHVWFSDFYFQGAFQPIPEDVLSRLTAELHPATMIGSQVNGVTYGVPGEIQVTGLMYNQRLLNESGLGGPPETWDDLVLVSRRMPRKSDGTYERLPLAVNGGGWGWNGNYMAILSAYGGAYVDQEGRIAVDSPEGVDTLRRIGEWFGPDGFGSDNRTPFLIGEGYFGIGYPWWMGFLRAHDQTSEAIAEYYRVGPMPAGPAGRGSYLYGWSFFVANDSPNSREAWRFLEWLALDRTGREMTRIDEVMGVALGSLPTHRADLARPELFEYGLYYQLFGNNLADAVADPILPNGTRRQDAIAQAVSAVIHGTQSPIEAATNLAQLSRSLAGQ